MPLRAHTDEDASFSPPASLTPSSVPPAPREPSARARRIIFGYQGAQHAMLWIGSAFLLVGGILSTVFLWGLPVDLALALQHETVQAEVLSRAVDLSVRINREHPTRVQVAFVHAGERHEAEVGTLDEELLGDAGPGDTVTLEVFPPHPAWARLEGATANLMGYGAVFVLLFPLLGALFAGWAVRGNRREKAAFRHGEAAWARVTHSGQDTTTKVNGRHPWQVRWELTVEGRTYRGGLSSMDPDDLRGLLGEEHVTVLYLREAPHVNTAWLV
jgi:hypothetical protein